jgi:LAS superfamily LD-carboxypeptidase LdcB
MSDHLIQENFIEEDIDIDDKIEFFEEVKKEKGNNIQLIIILFIIPALILVAILAFVQVSTISGSRDNCIKNLEQKSSLGIDISSYDCEFPKINVAGFEIPNYLIGARRMQEIERNLNLEEENLRLELDFLDKDIQKVINNLETLSVDYENYEIPTDQILIDQIEYQENYLELVEKIESEELEKIKSEFKVFELTLERNQKDLSLENYSEFYASASKLNDDEKISIYAQFQNQYKNLRKEIASQISGQRILNGFFSFSGEGFNKLFNGIPPTKGEVLESIKITGNSELDQIIITKAEQRGYQKQPVLNDIEVDKLGDKDLIIEVEKAFLEMQEAAKKEGIKLEITSSYRPVTEQRELFLERLEETFKTETKEDFSEEKILKSNNLSIVDKVLEITAPPGYSRHHSGYTIDLASSTSVFENSPGFRWISENNYQNAKKFGFIPSYPEGVEKQGPEPEAWEYVWVGKDLLEVE